MAAFELTTRNYADWLTPSFVIAGLLLAVLPLFHYGRYNDLVMRASIPALFVLQIIVAHLLNFSNRNWLRYALAGLLVLGSLYSLNLIRYHLAWYQGRGFRWSLVRQSEIRNLFHIQLYEANHWKMVHQYLGSTNTLFFRSIVAESEAGNVVTLDPKRKKQRVRF